MPRTARAYSPTEIYHVMMRAVNRQQIFFAEEDYLYFIELIRRYKTICGFTLYAYCLMGNHIHLLIGVEKYSLSMVLKRIECAFVYWYNSKYERIGHLFQDRFKSEPVNDRRYFLTVLRYILQNPVAAGICKSPEKYFYSSARQYILLESGITDVIFAKNMMKDELTAFLLEPNDDRCMDFEDTARKKCTDSKAKELIIGEFGTYFPEVPKKLEREEMNKSIRRIISQGVSIRQLSRLTGLTKKVIETGLKERTAEEKK